MRRELTPGRPILRGRLILALWLVLLVGATALSTGCARVQPWERDVLARRDMAFTPDELDSAIRDHVYFSKEASLKGGAAGGGGCGCN